MLAEGSCCCLDANGAFMARHSRWAVLSPPENFPSPKFPPPPPERATLIQSLLPELPELECEDEKTRGQWPFRSAGKRAMMSMASDILKFLQNVRTGKFTPPRSPLFSICKMSGPCDLPLHGQSSSLNLVFTAFLWP